MYFSIAQTCRQPKCPLTDEWIKKMWYIYTGNTPQSYHEIEWNNTVCRDMDGSKYYHTKWNKSDKDKCHMTLLICGI